MKSSKSILAGNPVLTTKQPKSLLTPNDWQAIIHSWESSGIPQKSFCEAHALSYPAFTYYRAQLKKEENKIASLLPVQLIQTRQSTGVQSSSNCCVVQWPNGTRLSVPTGVDATTLKMLLASLGGL